MFNWLKSFDKKYPYLIVMLLIFVGSGLLYSRLMGYIQRPTVLGFFLIGEGIYLFYKRFLKKLKEDKNKLSHEVADAMASKIKFEAEQHRKNRDMYNYIKISNDEEE
tara:strand:- start:2914 stop:3234 length:321 start_codon:yes stop_codon:yes gene_type:complete